MKKMTALLIACLLLACGCAPSPATDAGHSETGALTEALRPGEIPVSEVGDAAPLNGFSAALLASAASGETDNPVLSPVSAYLCLALVANGADGETRAAFSRVLGLEPDALNSFAHNLIAHLTAVSGATQLSIANSAWADDDAMSLDPAYLQRIVDYYGADAFSADLPSDRALQMVNEWVNANTNGLIPKLHTENYPDETVLLLINTLYFKAKWESPFLAYATDESSFTCTDGKQVTVPFLRSSGERDLIRTDDAEGIVLPYDDGKTAFVALRPTDGRTAREFAASLSADALSAYLSGAEPTYLDFSMPKFTVEYAFDMNETLMAMGLSAMFDPELANLTQLGTAAAGNIYVSRVFQKVKLIVDEEGTEAAAVTEAAMATGAIMDPDVLNLDSPFVYAVVDTATGAVLFTGVLDDPS